MDLSIVQSESLIPAVTVQEVVARKENKTAEPDRSEASKLSTLALECQQEML